MDISIWDTKVVVPDVVNRDSLTHVTGREPDPAPLCHCEATLGSNIHIGYS